jgi:periplasmic divalent cation tolerance protein
MEFAHDDRVDPNECMVAFIMAGSHAEALQIGRTLVERRLAACVNLVPGITSIFRWEGKISEEQEILLIVKSRHERFDEIVKAVKGLHSYQVPEIVGMRLSNGLQDYLKWMVNSTYKSLET